MRRFHSHCLTAITLLLSTSVAAEEYRVACPLSIESEAVQVIKVPSEWASAAQGPFWLHSAGPMDGPPSDLAVLKEAAKTQRIGKATVTRWDLSGTFASGKWMACNYGYSNEFILSRKLDPQTSECIVSSTARDTGKVEIDIRCRR